MTTKLREFIDSLPDVNAAESFVQVANATVSAGPASPKAPAAKPDNAPKDADKNAPQTDNSGLYSNDTVHVSTDGEVDEGLPGPDIEYVFFAEFVNGGKLPTDPCVVRFELTGDESWQGEFDLPQGVKPGAKVKAKVDFGPFANKFASYHLKACIYATSDPQKAIACAGEFEITITST